MPLRVPSLLWIVIGLFVAFLNDYLDSLGTISLAILAVLLWPLVLLGFDIRVSR